MTDNVVERPTDLTAEWLTAAIGAATVTDFDVGASAPAR